MAVRGAAPARAVHTRRLLVRLRGERSLLHADADGAGIGAGVLLVGYLHRDAEVMSLREAYRLQQLDIELGIRNDDRHLAVFLGDIRVWASWRGVDALFVGEQYLVLNRTALFLETSPVQPASGVVRGDAVDVAMTRIEDLLQTAGDLMEAEQFNQARRLRRTAESWVRLGLPAGNVLAPFMQARLDRIRYRFLQIDAVDSLRTWRGADAQYEDYPARAALVVGYLRDRDLDAASVVTVAEHFLVPPAEVAVIAGLDPRLDLDDRGDRLVHLAETGGAAAATRRVIPLRIRSRSVADESANRGTVWWEEIDAEFDRRVRRAERWLSFAEAALEGARGLGHDQPPGRDDLLDQAALGLARAGQGLPTEPEELMRRAAPLRVRLAAAAGLLTELRDVGSAPGGGTET